MHVLGWTPDRVKTLHAKFTLGWSASEIARELGGGVSRNAVSGKLNREGLLNTWARASVTQALNGGSRGKAARERGADSRRLQAEGAQRRLEAVRARGEDDPAPAPAFKIAAVPDGSLTLVDLKAGQCKYGLTSEPAGNCDKILFCAAETGDVAYPYCPAHRRVCFDRSKPRNPKPHDRSRELESQLRRRVG